MKTIRCLNAALAVFAAAFAVAAAAGDEGLREKVPALALVTEHITIPSDTPGIELYIRNKHPQEAAISPERILLYVHGATYPSETAFDLQLDGMSWMDYIAAHAGMFTWWTCAGTAGPRAPQKWTSRPRTTHRS